MGGLPKGCQKFGSKSFNVDGRSPCFGQGQADTWNISDYSKEKTCILTKMTQQHCTDWVVLVLVFQPVQCIYEDVGLTLPWLACCIWPQTSQTLMLSVRLNQDWSLSILIFAQFWPLFLSALLSLFINVLFTALLIVIAVVTVQQDQRYQRIKYVCRMRS